VSRRATARTKNTAQEERLLAAGETAALAGVGLDEASRLAALTDACGPYAIAARSAWLVGHRNGLDLMEDMAREAGLLALCRTLEDRDLGAERPARAGYPAFAYLDILDPETNLAFRVRVMDATAREISYAWTETAP
jgi:hypothetical protein